MKLTTVFRAACCTTTPKRTVRFQHTGLLKLIGLLLLLPGTAARSELIPANRLAPWSAGVTVGVPGGIDQYLPGGAKARTHLIDVTQSPYNADRTGTNDAQPAIQAAVNAASTNDVVYVPAGTYRLTKPVAIGVKKNITIRGAGPDVTKLFYYSSYGSAFAVGSSDSYRWDYPQLPITGNPSKGTTLLNVGDTSKLNGYPNGGIGQICHLSLLNDSQLPVLHVMGYERSRRQMSRIVAKTSTTVTISPGLYFDLPAALSPQLNLAGSQAEFVGVEDLAIDGSNCTTGAALINLQQAYGCWVKNVAMKNTPHYFIGVGDSFQCEVRHCDLRSRKTSGTNGAGIIPGNSSACLFEDNIVTDIFPHIEVNSGCAGNVIAYNLFEGNDVYGIMGVSINANHGPHNSFNLYEGNISSKFQSDGYFGSDSEETVFRNWLHATSNTTNQFGICIYLNRFCRNFNIVGNVLGRSGNDPATGKPLLYNYDNKWTGIPGWGGVGYGDRFIFVLGLPNIGNGGFSGSYVQPSKGILWSNWGAWDGPNGFQEFDLDVAATTIRKGNWNAKDGGVPTTETLGTDTLPSSLYRTTRPAWFGNLTWPAFSPSNPNQSFEAIPAGYRYLHPGSEAPGVGTGSGTPNLAPSTVKIQMSAQ